MLIDENGKTSELRFNFKSVEGASLRLE